MISKFMCENYNIRCLGKPCPCKDYVKQEFSVLEHSPEEVSDNLRIKLDEPDKPCKHCDDLNSVDSNIIITEVKVSSISYIYDVDIPVMYCPACGRKLNRYRDSERS